jgi:hypothetical protein
MERRYEVFISSTYEDLKEQRRYMQEAVIAAGHIPVGMELFNPGHEDQWRVITRAIDGCDHYVLIVGARYGSKDDDGMGYTEKEYRYALAREKPIVVFCLKPEGASDWPLRDDPNDPQKGDDWKRLQAFRAEVMGRYVHLWRDDQEFRTRVDRDLHEWINESGREGWIRWNRYSHAAMQRDVYTYMFNNLSPYRQVSLVEPMLKNLRDPLDCKGSVLLALTILMKEFVTLRVPPHVRAYFAYKLKSPLPMFLEGNGSHAGEALYAFGSVVPRRDIAHVQAGIKEEAWTPGFLVGRESSLDRAYESGEIKRVDDATRASDDPEAANQLVNNEGSVLSIPVLCGRSSGRCEAIGVLGLSSPHLAEVSSDLYFDLARELQSLFSALFYAYSLKLEEQEGRRIAATRIAARLRREIAEHFEETLAGKYPNLASGGAVRTNGSRKRERARR